MWDLLARSAAVVWVFFLLFFAFTRRRLLAVAGKRCVQGVSDRAGNMRITSRKHKCSTSTHSSCYSCSTFRTLVVQVLSSGALSRFRPGDPATPQPRSPGLTPPSLAPLSRYECSAVAEPGHFSSGGGGGPKLSQSLHRKPPVLQRRLPGSVGQPR